jgi:hypothetical protein
MPGPTQATGRRLATAGGRLNTCCFAEPELWHVDVDTFIAACRDAVCLVPDADGTVGADRTIECPPGRQVLSLLVRGVGEKLLDGTPVLENHGGPTAPNLVVQQAKLRTLLQFLEHARHRRCDWQPLVDLHEAVDSHTDEKHREVAVDIGGETFGADVTHGA